jgi:hypothetical protein
MIIDFANLVRLRSPDSPSWIQRRPFLHRTNNPTETPRTETKPECVLSDYQAATLYALQRSWKTSH